MPTRSRTHRTTEEPPGPSSAGEGAVRRHAVFVRGLNVGGRTVRMDPFVRSLAPLAVASVGAAGSFAVRTASARSTIAEAFARALPSIPFAILSEDELAAILESGPVGASSPEPETRWSASLLASRPTKAPRLPLERPEGASWQTRLLEQRGSAVLGVYRRRADPKERLVYPNEVVEREFGSPATTRWWETLLAVRDAFGPAPVPRRPPSALTVPPADAPRGRRRRSSSS